MRQTLFTTWKNPARYCVAFCCCLLLAQSAAAQPSYRTFNQYDLALKKVKDGKVIGSIVTFTFHNDETGIPVTSLHARFDGHILWVADSGGFTAIGPGEKKHDLDFTGRTVAAGDSAEITIAFDKKGHGTKADGWWWDTSGVQVGSKRKDLKGVRDSLLRTQPNGGNTREYIYKHAVRRPGGVVVGLSNTIHLGWIRYKEGDRNFFPHTDSSRCFDYIMHDGTKRPFTVLLKDPHVKKHNNHLLGELHALKLAIIANDSSITEPLDSLSTALGDLIYNDPANPGDPFNTMTLRQLVHLTDSALTYCGNFVASFYFSADSDVARINRAFDGPYVAESFKPLLLRGTRPLSAVPFLHPNPTIAMTIRPVLKAPWDEDDLPDAVELRQNYPNPFNPRTMIEFHLTEPSIVTLNVYNVLGQEVARLIQHEQMEDGLQSAEFDADRLGSGVYYYQLIVQGLDAGARTTVATKRMLLIK